VKRDWRYPGAYRVGGLQGGLESVSTGCSGPRFARPLSREAVSPTGEELSTIVHRDVFPDAAPQDRPCRRLNAACRAVKGCDGAVPKPRLPRNRMSESFAYGSVCGGGPAGRSIEVVWFEGMRHVIECR